MDRQEIMRIFEEFFEQYKKTEGDRSSWSAHWSERMPSGVGVEVNMTKCPKGTTFKVFKDGSKLGEISGWDAFFEDIERLVGADWDSEAFFSSMREMS